jgi:transcriptional regulator with XRE-family HTH domain
MAKALVCPESMARRLMTLAKLPTTMGKPPVERRKHRTVSVRRSQKTERRGREVELLVGGRLILGLRLADMASALDVAISTVMGWEGGQQPIPIRQVPAIAQAYRVDAAQLLSFALEQRIRAANLRGVSICLEWALKDQLPVKENEPT